MSAPQTPPASGKQAGAAKPFSIRLTDDERRLLAKRADGLPLGTYVRGLILADETRVQRGLSAAPARNRETLARLLAALGQSGIAGNLAELARAAKIGALPVTPETEGKIVEACTVVMDMRRDLICALGLREDGWA
jgi:hypothetical protein